MDFNELVELDKKIRKFAEDNNLHVVFAAKDQKFESREDLETFGDAINNFSQKFGITTFCMRNEDAKTFFERAHLSQNRANKKKIKSRKIRK